MTAKHIFLAHFLVQPHRYLSMAGAPCSPQRELSSLALAFFKSSLVISTSGNSVQLWEENLYPFPSSTCLLSEEPHPTFLWLCLTSTYCEHHRPIDIPVGKQEAALWHWGSCCSLAGRRPWSRVARHWRSVWLNPLSLRPNKKEHFWNFRNWITIDNCLFITMEGPC